MTGAFQMKHIANAASRTLRFHIAGAFEDEGVMPIGRVRIPF
jgi:hypothetical protein